jgi:hypothetical protein
LHAHRGKETIEHVLWKKPTWFDKYVRNATAETGLSATGRQASRQRLRRTALLSRSIRHGARLRS